MLKVVADYAYVLDILDKYDHHQLYRSNAGYPRFLNISLAEVGYSEMKKINGGIDVYPSVEEKAVNFYMEMMDLNVLPIML